MIELFLKHKVSILRSLGAIMLIVGFASHFWTTPKKVYTKNEIASANVARMEAMVQGRTSGAKAQSSSADILKHLKNTQETQGKYLNIFIMIFGVGFLGYSFIAKKK